MNKSLFEALVEIPINFSKNFQDFENIQFPTYHLEAENPFGVVIFLKGVFSKLSGKHIVTYIFFFQLVTSNFDYMII